MDKKTSQTDHRSLATGHMGITQEFSSQSITSHRPSSHRSLDRKYQHRGGQYSLVTSHQTLYQPSFSETHAMSMEFTKNNSKRVLLPLELDFSNMSDPCVVIKPPDNNWRLDNRQTLQTSLSGRISRRDQSRSKHKSKKNRRPRSSSSSSFSRSASSDSRKRSRKSKRSKFSHKKRRRYTSSSSSSSSSSFSLSDNQSHDYGRFKRSRHSPQAAQNPSMLQPAEITNVQTIPQTEQTLQHSPKDSGSDSEIKNWSFDRAIKFSGFCLRSYTQDQPRSMLWQSLYLALNT